MADIESKPGEVADKAKSRTAMMLVMQPAIFKALAEAGFDIPAAVAGKDAPTLRRFLRALVHIGLAPCLDAGAPPQALAMQLGEALQHEVEGREAKVKADVAEAGAEGLPAFPNKGSPLAN